MRPAIVWLGLVLLCAGAPSCSTGPAKSGAKRSKEYFSESEYGVKASPRVASGDNIPKGGGRYMVGNVYVVKGRRYFPREEPRYDKSGLASWYGSAFHGRETANGEVYDKTHLSAAHPTFPLPSYARVTNLENGASVMVRINDRGPFHEGRLIDVSSKAADLLEMKATGTAKVRVQYAGRAPLDGQDMPYLMASYIPKGDQVPGIIPQGQIATGMMVDSASTCTALAGTRQNPVTQALQTVRMAPAATAQASGYENFSMLPQIGPFIAERPTGNFLRLPLPLPKYAAAYAPETASGKAAKAKDKTMTASSKLTEQAILAYAKRQKVADL